MQSGVRLGLAGRRGGLVATTGMGGIGLPSRPHMYVQGQMEGEREREEKGGSQV